MVNLPLFDCIPERAHDVLLTDDVGERAGTVAAVERGTSRHGKPSLVARAEASRPSFMGQAPPGVRGAMQPRPDPGAMPHGCRARRGQKRDRAPSVEAGTRGAAAVSRLLFGAPAAPEGGRLRLLPSGPDLVHGSSSPRDRTINIAHRALTSGPVSLGRGFSPARADCGYRAPLAPRLARSKKDRTAPSAKNEAMRTVVLSDGGCRARGFARRRYLAHA